MTEPLPKRCDCGKILIGEDAEFWGECKQCRLKLPIQTAQHGDTKRSGSHTDRKYHGGQGNQGEW